MTTAAADASVRRRALETMVDPNAMARVSLESYSFTESLIDPILERWFMTRGVCSPPSLAFSPIVLGDERPRY